MNREKKFRFLLQYNQPTDEYYNHGEVETFWFNLLSDANGLARFPIDKHWTILRCDDFIGLEDRNGEEIYERDRVRFKFTGEYAKYYKKEYTGTICWDVEDVGFFIENDSEDYPHVKLWFTKDLEVL